MRFTIALVSLLLAGCAAQPAGPSLAKRSVETLGTAEPQRDVASTPPAGAALLSEIAKLTEQAESGERDFAALLPRADAAAAAAGGEASESWIAAQQLMSALEGARAESTRALAELDARIGARLNGGDETGLVELQTANARVAALVNQQNEALDRLRSRLGR